MSVQFSDSKCRANITVIPCSYCPRTLIEEVGNLECSG